MKEPSVHQLSNGLRLIYQPDPEVKSVLVTFFGKAGFRADPPGLSGLSHFLEHLLFDGTKSRPDQRELNNLIDFHGGRRNGETGVERVQYWARLISEHREVAFDFISDIIQNSLLRGSDIKKEQKIISDEIKRFEDRTAEYLHWVSLPLIYGDALIGTGFLDPEPLARFDQAMLKGFYESHYTASNFVLGVAGNLAEAEALSLGEKYFSGILGGSPVEINQPRPSTGSRFRMITKPVSQAGFQVSIPAVGRTHPERMKYRLFAVAFGTGPTSRLSQRLRQKEHLTYHAGARMPTQFDCGHIAIFTAMKEESLLKGYRATLEEIERMTNLTEQEFERAKNFLKSELIFEEDRMGDRQERLCRELLFEGRIHSIQEHLQEVEEISHSDLAELTERIIASPRVVVALSSSLDDTFFQG
jgi:predicted Zn-dependent peptidase